MVGNSNYIIQIDNNQVLLAHHISLLGLTLVLKHQCLCVFLNKIVMGDFHPFEVRGSDVAVEVGVNLNKLTLSILNLP